MMTRINRYGCMAVAAVATVTLLAGSSLAGVRTKRFVSDEEIGTIAALEGTAEIGRKGDWVPAAIGLAIQQGDIVRTGQPGKVRVVFQDDSVLALSDNSRVAIDEHVFDPNAGNTKSLFGLIKGKVNALVSDYYHSSGASYEIKTATAVAGVRGTEFSMAYDPRQELTEVVGITGRVAVHSLLDPTGPGVFITANESTMISKNDAPTQPRRLEDTLFRQHLQGVDFIGGGRAESLSSSHPLVAGNTVPQPDRASASAAPAGTAVGTIANHDASSLVGDTPSVIKAMGQAGQIGIVFGKGH